MLEGIERIKFDLPLAYTRAIRARAGIEGVFPRDVVMAALDAYLPKEIAEAKERMAQAGPGPAKSTPRGKKTD